MSLPPRGAWIEMSIGSHIHQPCMSLPPRGAWIEIPSAACLAVRACASLPPRGAWIEIAHACVGWIVRMSLPPRGAWIEIFITVSVAPKS